MTNGIYSMWAKINDCCGNIINILGHSSNEHPLRDHSHLQFIKQEMCELFAK